MAADHEVAGQADRLEFQAEAGRDEQIDDAQGHRAALAPRQHLIDQAVAGIGVVLGVAAKAPFVKEDPVDRPAFLPQRRGFDDQLPAARRHAVQRRTAAADVELGRDGAGEQ